MEVMLASWLGTILIVHSSSTISSPSFVCTDISIQSTFESASITAPFRTRFVSLSTSGTSGIDRLNCKDYEKVININKLLLLLNYSEYKFVMLLFNMAYTYPL